MYKEDLALNNLQWLCTLVLVMVLDWLPHVFLGCWFINSLCAHVLFKRSTDRDDTIYTKLLLTVRVVHLNKFPGRWQLKDKQNSPLTINYNLLKHNGVSIIFTKRGKLSLLLRLRERKLRYLTVAVFSIWFNFSQSEAFAGEALVLGEIFLIILLLSVRTSNLSTLLTLKLSIFIENSPKNKHSRLANQSQIISYSFSTFWQANQSNALISVYVKSIPSPSQILIGHPIKQQHRGVIN